ncbi:MAG: class I SAM-dependent methyltransferase [Alphaproteobacteria bacterium]|nr:class I SAM-dependent methyltransferase [Alphaproteobacteria bacterium]
MSASLTAVPSRPGSERPRRGAIDAVPDLTGLDLSSLAEGHNYGHSGYVERGFTNEATFYRDIVAGANFDHDEDILDLGCGFGRWSVFLAEVNRSVTGIDPMGGRLTIARNLSARLAFDNTVFAGGTSNELPFTEAQFDGAWCFSALHFVDRSQTLEELRRVLRADGRLFVGLYFAVGRMIALLCYAFEDGGWQDPDFAFAARALQTGAAAAGPPNFGTVDEIDAIMGGHGFRVERFFDLDPGRSAILSAEETEMLSDPAHLVHRFRSEAAFRERLLSDYQRLCHAFDYNLSFLARRI